MSHESQKERYRSLTPSVTEFRHPTEDASGPRWSGSDMLDAQSIRHHKPTVYPEMLRGALENTDEYSLRKFQKQASVKFDLTSIPQSFNLPVAFSVLINKVGTSPRSIVAAVELLVSIVGENKHQSITSLTADDFQRLSDAQNKAQEKLIDIVSEDENLLLTSLINLIDNLIKIGGDESNLSADLLPQETNESEHTDAATLKPHHPEKVGRPATLSRLKLADLLSQETNDSESIDAAILKPHRPEKVGRPATLPRLKLADLLSQETGDLASGEVDTGPAVGNEVW